MEKELLKNKKWETKNYVGNLIIYFLNAIIVSGILLLIIYLKGFVVENAISVRDYLFEIKKPVSFFVLTLIIFSGVFLYFFYLDRNYIMKSSNSQMMFFILEVSIIMTFVFKMFVSKYLMPVALVSILSSFLVSRRSAFFNSFIYCLFVFLIEYYTGMIVTIVDYFSIAIIFVSCIVGVLIVEKAYSRIRIILSSFAISIYGVIGVLIAMLVKDEKIVFADLVEQLICTICSGPLSAGIFMVVLPFFEAIFNKVTRFKLAELTDHKAKLIKRLIEEAPGTFNHSVVVSNIAEACATAIGEDALLARACAYYHDVGKLRHPNYFSENNTTNEDPHKDLTPELSTNIIKAHTTDGYNLLKKHNLPEEIVNVCREHHGTMPIVYFFDKAKKFTDGEVNISDYCYAGPKPQSKISAIIMIADSSEAIVRGMQERSRDKVRKAVEKVVADRIDMGQFDECDITFKELNIIINTIVNTLSGVYHSRVEYPKVVIDDEQKEEVKEIKKTKDEINGEANN